MAEKHDNSFAELPGEILISIFSQFSTRSLLPLTTTSRRIHDIIIRIIHTRILKAASLKNHQLVFECWHPSTKLSTPYYLCDYLGTDAFEAHTEPSPTHKNGKDVGELGNLYSLYSHFRPIQPDGDRRVWRPHPAGGWLPAIFNDFELLDEKYVTQNIDLESHELFSQLQSVVNIVKVGPRKGTFLSSVTIGEGLTRIWRDWLAERASIETGVADGKEGDEEYGKRLLWSSLDEHIGLRLRVNEREDVSAPVIRARYEDPNVGYTLQYEELVVRSAQLLLMVEESLEQEVSSSGKAIVIFG